MRKILLGLAACALIMTSCSKNEVSESIDQNNKALQFNFVTGSATRASEAVLADVQDNAVDISAYFLGVNSVNKANDLFFKQKLTYGGTPPNEKWSIDGSIRFMPEGGANFYATWPAGKVALDEKSIDVLGAVSFDYTVNDNGETDLMGAFTQSTSDPSITLNLRHLLSQVNFGVYGYKGAKITISDITIHNVCDKGTYTFSDISDGIGLWSDQDGVGEFSYSWTGGSTPSGWDGTSYTSDPTDEKYIFGDGGKAAVGTTAYYYLNGAWTTGLSTTTLKNSLILMPQKFVANGAYVTFTYTITDDTGAIVKGADGAIGKFFLKDAGPDWTNNFRYAYMLSFKDFLDDNKLTFDVTVETQPWVNYGGDQGIVVVTPAP